MDPKHSIIKGLPSIMWKKKKTLFYYTSHDKYNDLQFKICFNISLMASERFSAQKCFILSILLGMGGDENLIINFLWP